MCDSGLHASRRAIDALWYAPGPLAHLVECDDIVDEDGDKFVCRRRKILASVDATAVLRAFARWCALSVIDKWDAPEEVAHYLRTGDDSLRSAAEAAAWAAARSAAGAAARSAAGAAAWSAARSAAWAAARSAESAAESAAEPAALSAWWSVAESAAESAQNERLEAMLLGWAEAKRKAAAGESIADCLTRHGIKVSPDKREVDRLTSKRIAPEPEEGIE
jgi:hypothetical protein